MSKRILFNEEARSGVMEGINIVADAVKVTLGHGGRTVIISDAGMPARTTKDGVTVANAISLKDQIQDAGAKFIKEISGKTADEIGDGTTTVCVLMQEFMGEGLKLIASGVNPMLLKRGMETAVKKVVDHLDVIKIEVGDDNERLKQIAVVSANNDTEIGNLVGEVFKKIGRYGIVQIEDSLSEKTEINLIEGFQFDSGYASHHFINNYNRDACELENPYVLLLDAKIDKVEDIFDLMNKCAIEKRSLLIFADDFDNNVFATIVRNQNAFKACCVKYNYIGETKEELMQDLCALTGATLITEKTGRKINSIQLSDMGQCEKIICTQSDTTVMGGNKNVELVEARVKDAKLKIENAKHPYHKQQAERRLSKLSGSIAICKVGGFTEVERSEKKDRVDDAVRATKAAIEEGIVPGGGTALLRCATLLSTVKSATDDEAAGVRLIKNGIEKPALQICSNAIGFKDACLVVAKVGLEKGNKGYNVKTNKIEDLLVAGIIDPKKVVRGCVENAASAAAQILISQALIIEDKD